MISEVFRKGTVDGYCGVNIEISLINFWRDMRGIAVSMRVAFKLQSDIFNISHISKVPACIKNFLQRLVSAFNTKGVGIELPKMIIFSSYCAKPKIIVPR